MLASLLALSQVAAALPIGALPKDNPQKRLSDVRVNRTQPAVEAPMMPVFSAIATDAEITRTRVFEEPLIRIRSRGGAARDESRLLQHHAENTALARAIMDYLGKGEREDVSEFTAFLNKYKNSGWRISLLTNLGGVYRHTGYFLRALEAWEEAWKLGKNETEADARATVDKAVGELAELNARLGRYGRLERLLFEIGNRELHGPATEKLMGAREGLSMMRNDPGVAFRCGPMALDRIRAAANPLDALDPEIVGTASTRRGTSLSSLVVLAKKVSMDYQMAYRKAGADVIVPSVVHWKAGHFAAVTKVEPIASKEPNYLIQDPTFGQDIWVTKGALDDEASGYFLIPNRPLLAGWRHVNKREGDHVWGKGQTTAFDPEYQSSCDEKAKPSCASCNGMAEYNFHTALVALNIVDTPVGYTPPVGPAINFTVTYNQRDSFQPQLWTYWNLGPKWTSDWLSYVSDDQFHPDADATVYLRGGGQETYSNFDSVNQQYATQMRSRSVLVRLSPASYERRMPDGSRQVFAQSDGSTFDRKILMTEVTDPMGNTVDLNYSGTTLTSITDAIGQVTTLSYENGPGEVTKVTDPFGRFATFEYFANGLLKKITDVIGLTSEFTYTDGDFVSTMTTPYGPTNFTMYTNPNDQTNRRITATDPLNRSEKVEFKHSASGIPDIDPVASIPAGMTTKNSFLSYRNTFYWDKEAFADFPNDFTKAKLTHWLHDYPNTSVSSGIKESEKMPLERRVWYNYPGQSLSIFVGTSSRVSKSGRVLDDGITQLYQYQYDDFGNMTESIDPVNRRTDYTYDSNLIDLVDVRQTTGSANDLLAHYTYNTQHEPLTVTDAARQTTTYTYNAQGQVSTVLNARGEQTAYSYTNNYLMTVTGPVTGSTTGYTYDGYGRVRTVTDSDGYVLTTDYDNLDRPTKVTYPDSTFQQITYDKLDVHQTQDRLGRITTIERDALRRVTSITDPLMRPTIFHWCNCGGLHDMTDPLMHVTTWNRDLQGRVLSKVLADGTHSDYVYDATTSRLSQMTDAKSQVTHYQYFTDDDLKQVSYTNATISTPTVNYTYDPVYNRVATMMDGTGTTIYGYYPVVASPNPPQLGATQLSSIDGPLTNDSITYGYDELGRVLNRGINSVAQSQTYDALGRVSTLTNALGTFTYFYEGATNRVILAASPSPVRSNTMSYFGNTGDHRLQQIRNHSKGASFSSQFDYTYQAEGEIQTLAKSFTNMDPVTTTFTYDAADQLKVAAATTNNSWDYDTAANRTQETIAGAQTSFVYNNSVNELSSRSGAQGNATFIYDSNGSLISDGTRIFEWDGTNRLVAVNIGNHRSEFTYDGIGRRTRIVEKDNSAVTSDKRYLWCGGDICEERDSTGGTVQKRFFEQGVQDNGVNIHYTRDHLGSIREKTDINNFIIARYDYDEWGRQTVLAGSKDTFGYAGYFVHSPSGLLLTWYRAYDPNLGRWISRDPIEEEGGINLYGFVTNDPVNSIDRDGLARVQVCCRGLDFLKPLLSMFHHCYIRIESDDGKTIDTYGILGNHGSRKNQIPRHGNGTTDDDGKPDRNTGGQKSCKPVEGNACQIGKLKDGLDRAVRSGTCPSCEANYHEWVRTDLVHFFDGFNSNTWVFNMISGAGMKPPNQSRAPGYHNAPGPWYP
jgi:RHS repeat-associated protein